MSNQNETLPNETLDTRGLLCPLPVIRTQDRIKDLQNGVVLEVVASDPGVLHDIPAWCRVHGHHLIETKQEGLDIYVRLRVCKD